MPIPRRTLVIVVVVTLLSVWAFVFTLKGTNFKPSMFGQRLATTHSQKNIQKPEIHITEPAPTLGDLLSREKLLSEKEHLFRTKELKLKLVEDGLISYKSFANDVSLNAKEKSLVSYVYVESPSNRRNLEFFIRHGLYNSADFVFTFNGDTTAHELLPNHPSSPYHDPKVTNIEVIHRNNTCLDFGAHGETLLREWSEDGKELYKMGKQDNGGKKFWQGYSRFILMNASVRGPFLPYWSRDCWSEAFFGRITAQVKLVGMSYNCHGGMGHVQSMVWGLDRTGLEIVLQHPPAGVGYWCPIDMIDAIYGETRTTPTVLKAGYQVDVLTSVYHSRDGDDVDGDGMKDGKPNNYIKECKTDDFWHENDYHGFNIHPYETVFVKGGRKMQEVLLGNLTKWVDGSGYDSREFCDV